MDDLLVKTFIELCKKEGINEKHCRELEAFARDLPHEIYLQTSFVIDHKRSSSVRQRLPANYAIQLEEESVNEGVFNYFYLKDRQEAEKKINQAIKIYIIVILRRMIDILPSKEDRKLSSEITKDADLIFSNNTFDNLKTIFDSRLEASGANKFSIADVVTLKAALK